MTAFDTILAALEDAGMTVKGSAPKARAQCPHHDAQGLTLSVRQFSDRPRCTGHQQLGGGPQWRTRVLTVIGGGVTHLFGDATTRSRRVAVRANA